MKQSSFKGMEHGRQKTRVGASQRGLKDAPGIGRRSKSPSRKYRRYYQRCLIITRKRGQIIKVPSGPEELPFHL